MTLTANPSAEVIRADNISKVFVHEGVEIQPFRNVTLRIRRGEMLAIMGPSGSGKSTLLHVLGGIETPTSGDIRIEGQNVSELSDRDRTLLRRRRIGFIFQSFNLVPTLSVSENVSLPLMLDGVSAREAESRALAGLERVSLSHRLNHLPMQLSGGEQQRVAIARALVINPALVLADEPTGNLDSVRGRDITRLLRQAAHENHRTVVVVTHDIRVASQADRLIVLLDGRMTYDGPPGTDEELIAALKQEGNH
ncbi:MAG: ABC transporter ATP-binding protein [Planctomycetaceae bacterium]|nr:ABC transporter ATP-binding protein [Planctomycetaceae bacterium]